MARRKNFKTRSGGDRPEIKGFWNRVGTITAKMVKRIEGDDSAFYLVELTEPCGDIEDRVKGQIDCAVGDVVGLSESAATKCLADVREGTEIRLISKGKKINPKNEREFWDIEVQVDESESKPAPF